MRNAIYKHLVDLKVRALADRVAKAWRELNARKKEVVNYDKVYVEYAAAMDAVFVVQQAPLELILQEAIAQRDKMVVEVGAAKRAACDAAVASLLGAR